jgi:hypothetical protein
MVRREKTGICKDDETAEGRWIFGEYLEEPSLKIIASLSVVS